jgi:hypothetical protein
LYPFPLCFSSKEYQIPVFVCKKELDTACKIEYMRQSNTFLFLAKGSLIAFIAFAKSNQIFFNVNRMRNLRIACNADNVSNIQLGLELNKEKIEGEFLKFCLLPRFIPMTVQPYHFQGDLI